MKDTKIIDINHLDDLKIIFSFMDFYNLELERYREKVYKKDIDVGAFTQKLDLSDLLNLLRKNNVSFLYKENSFYVKKHIKQLKYDEGREVDLFIVKSKDYILTKKDFFLIMSFIMAGFLEKDIFLFFIFFDLPITKDDLNIIKFLYRIFFANLQLSYEKVTQKLIDKSIKDFAQNSCIITEDEILFLYFTDYFNLLIHRDNKKIFKNNLKVFKSYFYLDIGFSWKEKLS